VDQERVYNSHSTRRTLTALYGGGPTRLPIKGPGIQGQRGIARRGPGKALASKGLRGVSKPLGAPLGGRGGALTHDPES